jgi:nitrogen-specific signal transduction histidine kinase
MTVQEKHQTTEDVGSLAELTVECWRLLRLVERLIQDQRADRQAHARAQARYVRGRLDAILGARGIRLIAYDGEPYGPGLPVTIANADELHQSEALVVQETLEPTLVTDGRVVAMGKVILKQRD